MNTSQNTSREYSDATKAAVSAVFDEALLPYKFRTIVNRYLRDTPEYAQARSEGRAKEWLEQEASYICSILAQTLRDQLTRLDP